MDNFTDKKNLMKQYEKIRLKVKKDEIIDKISLNNFLEEFLNNFYLEMSIFGEYFSVQEHTNRTKFIEFINKKLCDLDKLILIVKSFYFYEDLTASVKIIQDFNNFHENIVGIADFMAGAFENMKVTFLPNSDFNLALQSFLNVDGTLPSILFNKNETILEEEIDYKEIHKLMKIYLLRENLSSKNFNYFLEKDRLILKSENLTFKIALCGELIEPIWKLVDVITNISGVKLYIMASFSEPNLDLIKKITKFLEFFENRNKARNIFKKLENPQGYYHKFSGYIKSTKIQGNLTKEGELNLFKLENNNFIPIEDIEDLEVDLKVIEKEFVIPKRFVKIGETFVTNFGEIFIKFSNTLNNILIEKTNFIDKNIKFLLIEENFNTKVILNYLYEKIEDKIYSNINPLLTFIDKNNDLIKIFIKITELKIPIKLLFKNGKYLIESKFFILNFDQNFILFEKFNDKEIHIFSGEINKILNFIQFIQIRHLIKNVNTIENILELYKFEYNGLIISLSDKIVTTNNYLNEDIKKLTYFESIIFIKQFGKFYFYNIIPNSITKNMIVFNFIDFLKENFTISFINQNIDFNLNNFNNNFDFNNILDMKYSGKKTIESLKGPSKDIEMKNKELKIDYKLFRRLYLINRFHTIRKKIIEKFLNKIQPLRMEYSDGQLIEFTTEGIKYISRIGGEFDEKVSYIFNNSKEYNKIIKGTIDEVYKEINKN